MKRVEGFPLKQLWTQAGDCRTHRLRDLLRDDADALIMERGAEVVVAEVGAPLLWPERASIVAFWKRTAQSAFFHTVTSHGQILEKSDRPAFLFYPYEWESVSGVPLVLLEMVCWPYDQSLKMY